MKESTKKKLELANQLFLQADADVLRIYHRIDYWRNSIDNHNQDTRFFMDLEEKKKMLDGYYEQLDKAQLKVVLCLDLIHMYEKEEE